MASVDDIKLLPWGETPDGNRWHGRLVSIAGTPVGPITKTDVVQVLYHYADPDDWDGHEVCVLELKDGRYAAYETSWGPTGDGFSEDAYGGDADIVFGRDLNAVILEALTDFGRRRLGIPEAGLS